MKQLNLIMVFVVAMFVVCGRCAPALAQEASAARTLDFQAQDVAASKKACTPTSTTAKCLLAAITALQAQVTTLTSQDSSLQTTLTAVQGQVGTLTSQVSSLQTSLTTAQGQVATLTSQVSSLKSSVTTVQGQVTTLTSQGSSLQTALTAVQNNHALALGSYVSVDSSAENGLKGPNIIFSGANVHIESGSGSTVDTSGLGNLVIGYNEDSVAASTIDGNRSGSHNLVVGPQHEFTGSGSAVFGFENFTSANYASISGGECSAAGLTAFPFTCSESSGAADAATVTGGFNNRAIGFVSSVSGGESNVASGFASSVSGGAVNTASGGLSSVSGGESNTAIALFSSVSGGAVNTASGALSSVSGGDTNTASGEESSILGGNGESVTTHFGFFP